MDKINYKRSHLILVILAAVLIKLSPETYWVNLCVIGGFSAFISYIIEGKVNLIKFYLDVACAFALIGIDLLEALIATNIITILLIVVMNSVCNIVWGIGLSFIYTNKANLSTSIQNAIPGIIVSVFTELEIFYGWNIFFVIVLAYLVYELIVKEDLTLKKGLVIIVYSFITTWLMVSMPVFSSVVVINLLVTTTASKLNSSAFKSTIKKLDSK